MYVIEVIPGNVLCPLHVWAASLATRRFLSFTGISVQINGIECPALLEKPRLLEAFLRFFLGLNLVLFHFQN